MMENLPDPENGEPVVENIEQCSQQTTCVEQRHIKIERALHLHCVQAADKSDSNQIDSQYQILKA